MSHYFIGTVTTNGTLEEPFYDLEFTLTDSYNNVVGPSYLSVLTAGMDLFSIKINMP